MRTFNCYKLDAKGRDSVPQWIHSAAYQMWREVWLESYKFFGWDPKEIQSNEWVRQDSICAVFEDQTPIGCVFFDEKNFELPFFYDDAYFRMWPRELLDSVAKWKNSKNSLIASNFTLAKPFRKKPDGIDYKALLHALALKHFLSLGNSFMLGTMVKCSGMDKLSYEHGAHTLMPDVEEKGLTVDLLYWRRSEILQTKFSVLNSTKYNIAYPEKQEHQEQVLGSAA